MIDVREYGEIISVTDAACIVKDEGDTFPIYLMYNKFGHIFGEYNDGIKIYSEFVSDTDGKRFETKIEMYDPKDDNLNTVEYDAKNLSDLFTYVNMYERIRNNKMNDDKSRYLTLDTTTINYTNADNKDADGFWINVNIPKEDKSFTDFQIRVNRYQYAIVFNSGSKILVFEHVHDEDSPRLIDNYVIDTNLVYDCHFDYLDSDDDEELKEVKIISYVVNDNGSIRVIESDKIGYPSMHLSGMPCLNAISGKLSISDGESSRELKIDYDKYGMAISDSENTSTYEMFFDKDSDDPINITNLHPVLIDDFDNLLHYDENLYSLDNLDFCDDIVYYTKVVLRIDDNKLEELKEEIKKARTADEPSLVTVDIDALEANIDKTKLS